MPADQLLVEGRAWLRRITQFQGQRLTLKQHREILVLAGWIALLIACVEYDSGNRVRTHLRQGGRHPLVGRQLAHAVEEEPGSGRDL
jgi:DNA-binding CsgD family transcriptional regulator